MLSIRGSAPKMWSAGRSGEGDRTSQTAANAVDHVVEYRVLPIARIRRGFLPGQHVAGGAPPAAAIAGPSLPTKGQLDFANDCLHNRDDLSTTTIIAIVVINFRMMGLLTR